MVFVDTSVWISYFHGRIPAEELQSLIDQDRAALSAAVRIELLGGVSRKDRNRLVYSLSALPVFFPSEKAWHLMEEWVGRAAEAGEQFGMGDLLIAATAAEHGGEVWSLDRDFRRMERLGFLRLYSRD